MNDPLGARTRVVAGALAGLAWAASLRGWMAQIAGPSGSAVTWLTAALVLLPGMIVGAALGWSTAVRTRSGRSGRLVVLAPVVFTTAIADPPIFHQLITDGRGGGSLLVVITMLAGGWAAGTRGHRVLRVVAGGVALLGIATMFAAGSLAAPLTSPRGLWVAVYGSALLALAALASAIPYRALAAREPDRPAPGGPALHGTAGRRS